MADKGIIFSAPMVRALLDGRKTQTRRLLNPQPLMLTGRGLRIYRDQDWKRGWRKDQSDDLPYAAGDRLYVRENWNTFWLSQDGEQSWPTKEIPDRHPNQMDLHRNAMAFVSFTNPPANAAPPAQAHNLGELRRRPATSRIQA